MVMVTAVRHHDLHCPLAATVLTVVLQIIAGWARLTNLMRFVSRTVITGFVNALAMLILLAQPPELIGMPNMVYLLVAIGLGIIYLLPLSHTANPPLPCAPQHARLDCAPRERCGCSVAPPHGPQFMTPP